MRTGDVAEVVECLPSMCKDLFCVQTRKNIFFKLEKRKRKRKK
jgi:hypothetical protein